MFWLVTIVGVLAAIISSPTGATPFSRILDTSDKAPTSRRSSQSLCAVA